MGKRVFFFILVNLAMIAMISLVTQLFGIEPYLNAYGINYKSLAIICTLYGMTASFISLLASKWMAKKMMGVQILDPRGQHAELVNIVHRLAKAANLPKMPEVGVYNSPEVNAFATGPSRSNSLVAVSTGLLESMNRDEVEGVLGHEIAHIANGDMVTMALVQGVVNAFTMFLARIAAFFVQQALSSDDEEGGGLSYMSYYLTVFVFDMLFGILGSFVVAWYSRMREYRADEGGARIAGKSSMISALQRLQNQFERPNAFDNRSDQFSVFKISSKPTGIRSLMSTHPPLQKRIERLQRSHV